MEKVSIADVYEHFGGPSGTARALHITRQAVDQWRDEIPEIRASALIRIKDFPWSLEQLPVKPYRPGPTPRAQAHPGVA